MEQTEISLMSMVLQIVNSNTYSAYIKPEDKIALVELLYSEFKRIITQ